MQKERKQKWAAIIVSSVESQKGVITVQRCSIENQKGTIAVYKVYGNSTLLVLNGTSLICNNALLVLNWRYVLHGDSDYFGKRKQVTKVTFLVKEQIVPVISTDVNGMNIMMSYLTYLLAGWVFMDKIRPGRRAHWVKYKIINNSDLDGMSLASFCQSRAAVINSPLKLPSSEGTINDGAMYINNQLMH